MERKHNHHSKKISIVIPCYNREKTIERAIKSALPKKDDVEIIVVDDGSTDSSVKLIKTFKEVTLIELKQNSGVNVARNTGIKKAKGEYILFLDSDDSLVPDWYDLVTSKKLDDITFFSTITLSGKELSKLKHSGTYSYKDWLAQETISGEFMPIVKRDIFKTQLFDEERFCFETFFWNTIIKKFSLTCHTDHLRIYYYDAGNQVSHDLMKLSRAKQRYKDYKKYLKLFEKDYLRFDLKKKLGFFYVMTGVYAAITKNDYKEYFRKAKTLSTSYTLFYVLSLLGRRSIISAYKIYTRNKK